MPESTTGDFRNLGIGRACVAFGLTLRAIRFYEERGLVEAKRDRKNHRYYDAEGRRRLGWIAELRNAGLTLERIEAVFKFEDAQRSSADIALTELEARRVQLLADLRRVEATIRSVETDRDGKHRRVDAA